MMNTINKYKEIDIDIIKLSLVLEGSLGRGHVPVRKGGRHLYGIVFVTSGLAHYQLQGICFDAKAGCVFTLSKGCQYSIDILSDDYRYIYADFDLANYQSCDLMDTIFDCKNYDSIATLFTKMNSIWFQKTPAYRLSAKAVLFEIFTFLIQKLSMAYIPRYKYDQISRSVDYMSKNFFDKELSIAELARLSGVSEVHFRRLFKDIYLISPKKYLNGIRINRAKDILKEGIWSVTAIAEMVGYSNVYYFSQSFRKEVGRSPTEYSKVYMNQNNTILSRSGKNNS